MIAYLHQYFNTPGVGGGTRSYEIAKRLISYGLDVHVITSARDNATKDKKRTTYEGQVPVTWIRVPYSNDMGSFRRVVSFLTFSLLSTIQLFKLKPNIIYATSTPLTIILPALIYKLFKSVQIIFEVRDIWPEVPIQMGYIKNRLLIWLCYKLEYLAYHYSVLIVALAPGMKQFIIDKYEIAAEKIIVVPNGCDIELFGESLSVDSNKLQKDYPFIENKDILLYAGTLGKANGVHVLVDIAKEMIPINKNCIIVIIGNGSEFSKIFNYAEEQGVLNKNIFMIGYKNKYEVASWLHISKFSFCLFNGPEILWKHAVQNKFFDSLSSSTPTISNFTGYQSEIAVENNCGLIIDDAKPYEAAYIISSYLYDLHWYDNAKINCMRLAAEEFNRDSQVNYLYNSIKNLPQKNDKLS